MNKASLLSQRASRWRGVTWPDSSGSRTPWGVRRVISVSRDLELDEWSVGGCAAHVSALRSATAWLISRDQPHKLRGLTLECPVRQDASVRSFHPGREAREVAADSTHSLHAAAVPR